MSTPNNDEDGGVYFDPYDDQLINKYLLPKLRGEKDFKGLIVMENVYDKEPWLLNHTKHPLYKKNEWFYFVTRTQVSQKNIGCGRKTKRMIMGGSAGGSWKANSKKDIKDPETGLVIGKKQTLTFKKSNDNQKKQKTGEGASVFVPGSESTWTMYEYMLPGEHTFQELVLCKIKKSKTKDDDQPDESIPDSSSEHQPTNIDHQTVLAHSSLEQQQATNIDHQTVLAPSYLEQQQTVLAPWSLEQQQPLLWGGNGPEVPHLGYMSSSTSYYAAETERVREHSGEGNMVNQIDAFSMMETVPERSSQKDGKFEAMEVTQEVDWFGGYDLSDIEIRDLFTVDYVTEGLESVLGINTEDQQQPPIPAPSHMNVVAPARLGDKSLPIELDEDED